MDSETIGRRYMIDTDGEPVVNLDAELIRLTTEYGYARRAALGGPFYEAAMKLLKMLGFKRN